MLYNKIAERRKGTDNVENKKQNGSCEEESKQKKRIAALGTVRYTADVCNIIQLRAYVRACYSV